MPRPEDDADNDRSRNRDQGNPSPVRRKRTSPLLIVGVVLGLCVVGGILLIPTMLHIVESPQRMLSANNLKQIGLACHNYGSTNDEWPTNICDPDGKPLLSWRVLLLPYLEHDILFRQFKLDEPWDSPNNIRLLNQMPRYYANPKEPSKSMTYYRGFSSPGAVFEKRSVVRLDGVKKEDPLSSSEFKDSTSEIIIVVEAGEPVEWTKPDELHAFPDKPLPPLGGIKWSRKRMHVLFADGSVRFMRTDMPETTLRALISHSGGETLPPDWDE